MTIAGTSPILLFIKAPVRGRVKSRLASTLGEDAALELYQAFVLDILDTIDASNHPVEIFLTPTSAQDSLADWLGRHRRYHPQDGDDLGRRMENAFRSVFAEGATRAVLIGSDFPDLPGGVITEAFAGLQENDAVIGPAVDGGYYLIGFRNDSFLPGVFQDIPWSTNSVFRETMERFARTGSRVRRVRQWQDVDTVDDLRSLEQRMSGTAFGRSHTMRVLNKYYDAR